MSRTTAAIPEDLHEWIDFGLGEAPVDVFQNDEMLVGCITKYEKGNALHTFITHVTETRLFSSRSVFVFAVCDTDENGQTTEMQLTDELAVSRRDGGMVTSMKMRTRMAAMTRAVADVLGYGAIVPFKRDRPVERTTVLAS